MSLKRITVVNPNYFAVLNPNFRTVFCFGQPFDFRTKFKIVYCTYKVLSLRVNFNCIPRRISSTSLSVKFLCIFPFNFCSGIFPWYCTSISYHLPNCRITVGNIRSIKIKVTILPGNILFNISIDDFAIYISLPGLQCLLPYSYRALHQRRFYYGFIRISIHIKLGTEHYNIFSRRFDDKGFQLGFSLLRNMLHP